MRTLYPRREEGEIDEDGTVDQTGAQFPQLLDGSDWREGLIDSNSQGVTALLHLLLNVVGLPIPC